MQMNFNFVTTFGLTNDERRLIRSAHLTTCSLICRQASKRRGSRLLAQSWKKAHLIADARVTQIQAEKKILPAVANSRNCENCALMS